MKGEKALNAKRHENLLNVISSRLNSLLHPLFPNLFLPPVSSTDILWNTWLCMWVTLVCGCFWMVYALMLCLCLFLMLLVCAWLGWSISLLHRILDCIAVISHITALVVIASTLDSTVWPTSPFWRHQKGEDMSMTLFWLVCLVLSWLLNSCVSRMWIGILIL